MRWKEKDRQAPFIHLTSLLFGQAIAYRLARPDNQAFCFSHSAAASPMVFGVPSRIQAIKDLSKRNAGPQASRIKRRTFWVLRYPELTGVCGVITSRCQSKAESSRASSVTLISQSLRWERPKDVPKVTPRRVLLGKAYKTGHLCHLPAARHHCVGREAVVGIAHRHTDNDHLIIRNTRVLAHHR